MKVKKQDPVTKVAILYIATGRYTIFWDFFYRSAEKFLLTDCQKHYFVFSDSKAPLLEQEFKHITQIHQDKLGWPYDTLFRFEFFLSIKEQLKSFDYVLFFNGNSEILSEINSEDILPLENTKKLVFAHQPHMFHLPVAQFTYDRNPKSLAYIPSDCGQYYFTGALNGGEVSSYLRMCEVLVENIKIDLSKGIVALWHDESHLNHYALNRNDIKVLLPYFSRGESEYWKTDAKVMFSDKTHYRFGGHKYLRGESNDKIKKTEWEKTNGKPKRKYKLRIKQYWKSLFL